MKNKEILGGDGLITAFQTLGIHAVQKYKGKDYEVWELSPKEYERLAAVPDEDWLDDFGWWRYGECVLEGSRLHLYTVNGAKMLGYLNRDALDDLNDGESPEDMMDETYFTGTPYQSFTDWLSFVYNLGAERHIACFAISLAKANGVSLAQFMKNYQP